MPSYMHINRLQYQNRESYAYSPLLYLSLKKNIFPEEIPLCEQFSSIKEHTWNQILNTILRVPFSKYFFDTIFYICKKAI